MGVPDSPLIAQQQGYFHRDLKTTARSLLHQHILDHMPVNIRQAAFNAVVVEG